MPKIKKKSKKRKILKKKSALKIQISKKNKELKQNNQSSNETKKSTTINLEEKPTIKKIKKQQTEKREYKIKDYVVYPKHGVGKITGIDKSTIGQIEIHFYKIFIEKEKLTLTVPINQQSNLRPIASTNQISKCVSILKVGSRVSTEPTVYLI